MDGLAFNTAHTPTATSESAATRSRSTWSITAMSPGRKRPTSRLVRRSSLTGPLITPGSALRGRRNVGKRIATILACADTYIRRDMRSTTGQARLNGLIEVRLQSVADSLRPSTDDNRGGFGRARNRLYRA